MSKKARAEAAAMPDSAAGDVAAPPAPAVKSRRRAIPAVAEPEGPTEIHGSGGTPIAEALGIVEPAAVEFRRIPLAQVFPSPLNPRQTLPDEAADLRFALSIAQKGVLQPILVRPAPQLDIEGERFEIIMGSRRWRGATRALDGVADDAGVIWRLPPDYGIPCLIRPCTDDELEILAGVENFDREPMEPLDEARLFERLRPRVKPAPGQTREAAVAGLFHIGERTVFRRLALLRCAPEVREALRGKKITLAHAQAYSLGDPDKQRDFLIDHLAGGENNFGEPITAADVKYELIEEDDDKIPAEQAFFDPALYQGRVIEDPETEERWFADPGEFKRLQELAIRAKAEELKAEWPWVEIDRGGFLQGYQTYGIKKSDPEAGAVIRLGRDNAVQICAPALKDSTLRGRQGAAQRERSDIDPGRTPPGGGASKSATPARLPLAESQIALLHEKKTQALRRAVIDRRTHDGHVPVALACLGLLGATEIRSMAERGSFSFDNRVGPAVSLLIESVALDHLLKTVALELPDKFRKTELNYAGWHSEAAAAWFGALMTLPAADLHELHTRLLAERVGSWLREKHSPGGDVRLGDSPLAAAIALYTGAEEELAEIWSPDKEWFLGYGKDRLVAIVRDQLKIRNPDKMKKGELADLCAEQPKGFWKAALFPECRFQSEADAVTALAGPLPVPGAPKPAAARSDEECIAEARGHLARYDAAIHLHGGAHSQVAEAADRIEAIAVEMNGGERFGMVVDEGGQARLAHALAAAPGEMPLWGQPGGFVMDMADGERLIPIQITTRGLFGITDFAFEARAVAPDLPFINDSGYRSFLSAHIPQAGQNMTAWALAEIESDLTIDEKGKPRKKRRPLVMLDEKHRAKLQAAAAAPAAEPVVEADPIPAAAE